MKCITVECRGNSVSSGWASQPEQSLRKKKNGFFRTTKKNKTEKMKTEKEKKKHVSADVSLPDMRGEKTEAGDGPKCGGNNRRNIWLLGDRTRNSIFSAIIPCATLEVTTSRSRSAPAGHHVLA